MFDIGFNILAFIVALGVLVSFHEFGHFWVARKLGVKVLRFSVGFGTPLWKRTGKVDNTEYVVAAIPLGGYVRMLDEREGDVPADERDRAFNRQSVAKRVAIVAAGPLANFLLAIVTYWFMFMLGISGIVPIVGDPVKQSLADAAGFRAQDEIVAVDGEAVSSWDQVRIALLESGLAGDAQTPVTVDVIDDRGDKDQRVLKGDIAALLKEDGDIVANLGLKYWWPILEPIVAGVQEGGPAAAAGIRPGDRIVQFDGVDIGGWRQFVSEVRQRPSQLLVVVVERREGHVDIELTTGRRDYQGDTIGFIGAWENQSASAADRMRAVTRFNPLDAFAEALTRT